MDPFRDADVADELARFVADAEQPRVPPGSPNGGEFAASGSGSGSTGGKPEKEHHTIFVAYERAGERGWGQQAATSKGLEAAKKLAHSLQNRIATPKGAPEVRIVKGRAALSNRKASTAEDPETQHVYSAPGWGAHKNGFPI